jgi:hypothetical protein
MLHTKRYMKTKGSFLMGSLSDEDGETSLGWRRHEVWSERGVGRNQMGYSRAAALERPSPALKPQQARFQESIVDDG